MPVTSDAAPRCQQHEVRPSFACCTGHLYSKHASVSHCIDVHRLERNQVSAAPRSHRRPPGSGVSVVPAKRLSASPYATHLYPGSESASGGRPSILLVQIPPIGVVESSLDFLQRNHHGILGGFRVSLPITCAVFPLHRVSRQHLRLLGCRRQQVRAAPLRDPSTRRHFVSRVTPEPTILILPSHFGHPCP